MISARKRGSRLTEARSDRRGSGVQMTPEDFSMDDARDALMRSGYLLEYRIESVLRNRSYWVHPSALVLDPSTGKTGKLTSVRWKRSTDPVKGVASCSERFLLNVWIIHVLSHSWLARRRKESFIGNRSVFRVIRYTCDVRRKMTLGKASSSISVSRTSTTTVTAGWHSNIAHSTRKEIRRINGWHCIEIPITRILLKCASL